VTTRRTLSRMTRQSEMQEKDFMALGNTASDGQPYPPSTPKDREHWAVMVDRNGDNILTIESAILAGKPDLEPEDEACIEMCGRQLLAFLGFPDPPHDRLERLRGIREAHCQAARRVPTDPELAAYRYGKAEGISEVLRLLQRRDVDGGQGE
jgi:hypothetical protein